MSDMAAQYPECKTFMQAFARRNRPMNAPNFNQDREYGVQLLMRGQNLTHNRLKLRYMKHIMYMPISGQLQPKCHLTNFPNHPVRPRPQSTQLTRCTTHW